MWASEASKTPILEFNLEKMLAALELTQDQFIDVCILAGCDYCDTIKGVAATTAYRLVKKEGSLDAVLASLDPDKHPVPADVDYDEVRALFVAPEVADPAGFDFKWGEPDEAGLKKYLSEEKGFAMPRVEKGIATLKKARAAGSQSRMDSFFSAVPSGAPAKPAAAAASAAGGGKRKLGKDAPKPGAKKAK
jgi:flap endonuclease-1